MQSFRSTFLTGCDKRDTNPRWRVPTGASQHKLTIGFASQPIPVTGLELVPKRFWVATEFDVLVDWSTFSHDQYQSIAKLGDVQIPNRQQEDSLLCFAKANREERRSYRSHRTLLLWRLLHALPGVKSGEVGCTWVGLSQQLPVLAVLLHPAIQESLHLTKSCVRVSIANDSHGAVFLRLSVLSGRVEPR